MKTRIPHTAPDDERTRILERPDGYYWRRRGANREYGPFETLVAAMDDMQVSDEEMLEPGETLQEAEAELGIAAWIDPDTGTPAEGAGPRLEDH